MAYYMSPQGPRRLGTFKAGVFKAIGKKITYVKKPRSAAEADAMTRKYKKSQQSAGGDAVGRAGGKPGRAALGKKPAVGRAGGKPGRAALGKPPLKTKTESVFTPSKTVFKKSVAKKQKKATRKRVLSKVNRIQDRKRARARDRMRNRIRT